MTKVGKVESWYIDPDDGRLTSTNHNIIFGEDKLFVARHDDVDNEDYDSEVEIGEFELSGKSFNARFVDIFGRINYTNTPV